MCNRVFVTKRNRMKYKRKTWGIFLALVPSSLMLISCGDTSDLKAAEKYGLMAAEFEASTTKLADDIYNSCIRRAQYIPLQAPGNDAKQEEAIQDCNDLNRPQAANAKKANQVLINYMVAVGQLASDNTVKFNESLVNITKALNGLNIEAITLNTDQVDAGVGIANFFIDWITREFRRGNLKQAILCTDDSIQSYSKGLTNVFQEGYIDGILEQESDRIRRYYEDYATVMRQRDAIDREFRALELEKFQAIDASLKRRDAAYTYLAIINKTAEFHGGLKEIFAGNEPLPTPTECEQYLAVKDESKISQSSSADNWEESEKLTFSELQQVSKIAAQYQEEVMPLIRKLDDAF